MRAEGRVHWMRVRGTSKDMSDETPTLSIEENTLSCTVNFLVAVILIEDLPVTGVLSISDISFRLSTQFSFLVYSDSGLSHDYLAWAPLVIRSFADRGRRSASRPGDAHPVEEEGGLCIAGWCGPREEGRPAASRAHAAPEGRAELPLLGCRGRGHGPANSHGWDNRGGGEGSVDGRVVGECRCSRGRPWAHWEGRPCRGLGAGGWEHEGTKGWESELGSEHGQPARLAKAGHFSRYPVRALGAVPGLVHRVVRICGHPGGSPPRFAARAPHFLDGLLILVYGNAWSYITWLFALRLAGRSRGLCRVVSAMAMTGGYSRAKALFGGLALAWSVMALPLALLIFAMENYSTAVLMAAVAASSSAAVAIVDSAYARDADTHARRGVVQARRVGFRRCGGGGMRRRGRRRRAARDAQRRRRLRTLFFLGLVTIGELEMVSNKWVQVDGHQRGLEVWRAPQGRDVCTLPWPATPLRQWGRQLGAGGGAGDMVYQAAATGECAVDLHDSGTLPAAFAGEERGLAAALWPCAYCRGGCMVGPQSLHGHDIKVVRWAMPTRRVGEADHPGPAFGTLRRMWAPGSTTAYADPSKEGFSSPLTAGFPGGGGSKAEDEHLVIETVNATGWGSLKRRMRSTTGHVILAQETWVRADRVAACSAWARRHGWKTVWNPAVEGNGGGTSAGTMIAVREQLGLRLPPVGHHIWVPGHVSAAVLDARGYRPICLVSCYFKHGIGMKGDNVKFVSIIQSNVTALGEGWQYATGGDFNMTAAELQKSGLDFALAATVAEPLTARGTCRTRTTGRVIDYFVLSPGLARVLSSVKALEATGVKTHTPVQLSLKGSATAFRSLYLRPPPRIPHERLYGPLPPPLSWEPALLAARAAVEAASGGDARRAAELIDEAYRVWAGAAETELGDVTGCALPKRGLRASRPKLVWRSVLGDVKPESDGHYPAVAVTAWLRGAAGELVRLAQEAVAEDAARAGSGGGGGMGSAWAGVLAAARRRRLAEITVMATLEIVTMSFLVNLWTRPAGLAVLKCSERSRRPFNMTCLLDSPLAILRTTPTPWRS